HHSYQVMMTAGTDYFMKSYDAAAAALIVLVDSTPNPPFQFISETWIEPSALTASTTATCPMLPAPPWPGSSCMIAPADGELLTAIPEPRAALSQLEALPAVVDRYPHLSQTLIYMPCAVSLGIMVH